MVTEHKNYLALALKVLLTHRIWFQKHYKKYLRCLYLLFRCKKTTEIRARRVCLRIVSQEKFKTVGVWQILEMSDQTGGFFLIFYRFLFFNKIYKEMVTT